ncbi:MAG TPA: TetR family transcriptional regulator [Acidimicrobiales bacterium]|nr:TetR family transcriptional regulator [Acidimicrobiales bacterium]
MPRDATATRERLLREAERLFAREGLYRVTTREITQAAGQRNVSALNYHFGSRDGVVDVILTRHGDRIDEDRGKRLARIGPDASTRELVAALVIPYSTSLETEEGRDYLRIVAQMTDAFAAWRDTRPGVGPWLQEILELIEARPPALPLALRQERVLGMIMLMTAAMADRARLIEERRHLPLGREEFLANLTDMLVGILEAPVHEAALKV